MEVRRRNHSGGRPPRHLHSPRKEHPLAGDVLPLPLWLTNRVFALIFCAATWYLIKRWRLKFAHDIPLHYITFPEAIAMALDMSAFVYLIGFFGIAFVQTAIKADSSSDEDTDEERVEHSLPPAPSMRPAPRNLRELGRPPLTPAAQRLVRHSSTDTLSGPSDMDDEALAGAVSEDRVPGHSLEKLLGDPDRAVRVRRRALEMKTGADLGELPHEGCDYGAVVGQCAENVIGHVSVPLGVAGPLLLDGTEYHVPMATTEGALIASTNRGMKAIALSGGCNSELLRDGMTRAPALRMPNVARAAALKFWVEDEANFAHLASAFNATSSYARLQTIKCMVAGRNCFLRFCSSTGDAMGMNMVSKGVNAALEQLVGAFPDVEVISISGNVCADKKPAAINWVEGRGKSVVCEAVLTGDVVRRVLKTTPERMVDLNITKNLTGSAVAGSMGGFNAHAANMVAAVFMATGQDVAQVVESSNCITLMELHGPRGEDLHVSVTMPTLEVGTVGGGTVLPPQAAALGLLGVRGACRERPGHHAAQLARVVAASVLAGELSLMAALATGDLVRSHMKYNRSLPSLSALAATLAESEASSSTA